MQTANPSEIYNNSLEKRNEVSLMGPSCYRMCECRLNIRLEDKGPPETRIEDIFLIVRFDG